MFTKVLGIVADAAGNMYIVDSFRIRYLDITTNIISNFMGIGTNFAASIGDGGLRPLRQSPPPRWPSTRPETSS